MDDFQFRKYFCPLELINLMGKVVCRSISLNSQLQLSHNMIIDYNLHCYIADRNGISESTFDLFDYESRVLSNECLYRVYSLYDIRNFQKYTFSSNHVAYFEGDT